jgi:hypothetical protein
VFASSCTGFVAFRWASMAGLCHKARHKIALEMALTGQKPVHLEICFGDTYAFRRQIVAAQMSCIFCRSNANLTDEHVFPAFMGGELIVKDGSCETCNRDFGVAEATLKQAITPLLNLLQI